MPSLDFQKAEILDFIQQNPSKEKQRLELLQYFWISGWVGTFLIIITALISVYFFIYKTPFLGPLCTGISIALTIAIFAVNHTLSKNYQQWMEKEILVDFMATALPTVTYAPQQYVSKERLPNLNDEQGQPKYLIKSGSHYLSGTLKNLHFELSELEVASDLRYKKVKLKDRFHFKGVFIRVDGLPKELKDDFVKVHPPLAESWAKLAKFWGEAPFFQLDGEGTGYFYLAARQPLFDTRPNQHSLREKPYEGYMQQLEHSLGWVEKMDAVLST